MDLETRSLRRANDLRVFTFSELKLATRGFSRTLMIGEGGFGCVYRGVVRVLEDEITDGFRKMDLETRSLWRANDLRVFTFSEFKFATRGFSRALMIGEGGFGCVYRGVVRVPEDEITNGSPSKMDVAIKQLNQSGFQACLFFDDFRFSGF
ncbi:hypothetical protein FNV43_RR04304 [Rhamnella rubrinervis]|uniref:Uncharacterized protein n=1 Tax=Rhamnella rubrinervis TaxID=2594499 RepID=A0A8K0MQ43_9ROSA|nr:hypothetical protein FNV43_RR04304 [Rhamnella rubrinervis]